MVEGLTPLASTRRAEGVFERLRQGILAGAFPPGSRLPNERELAEALGVNRSSVREALRQLEFLELVEVRHGLGTFVRPVRDSSALQLVETLLREPGTVTVELLRQILEFRRDITLSVVTRAAENRTSEQLARARELLAREEAAGDDPEEALRLDVELNALLGEATGNLMYRLLANLFARLIERLGPIYYNRERDHRRSLATHRELLRAIEARDASAARRIVGVMLDYSEEKILAEAARLEAEGRIGPGAGGDLR